jgi:hypothetical protein
VSPVRHEEHEPEKTRDTRRRHGSAFAVMLLCLLLVTLIAFCSLPLFHLNGAWVFFGKLYTSTDTFRPHRIEARCTPLGDRTAYELVVWEFGWDIEVPHR